MGSPPSPTRASAIAVSAWRWCTGCARRGRHRLDRSPRSCRIPRRAPGEERLIAYQNLRRRLARLDEAEQNEVDILYGLLRGPAPAAKAQSGPTMALIRELLTASSEDVSAAAIAERIGVSRSTAQRYLSALARQGDVELRLHYGCSGRPEHRYRSAR